MSSQPDGLLEILDVHGAKLYALLTRLTLRAGVAGDLLQELFLKLHDSDSFLRADNRKAYVFRTAINLAFDWRRRQRPSEPLSLEPAITDESPLDQLIEAEEMEQVLDGIERLSPLARQALVLRYLQHQEYSEIAAALGKTEHQVRGLCAKAIGELRTQLRPAPTGPETRPVVMKGARP